MSITDSRPSDQHLRDDWATCPLPPAENRLAVAVEAGERNPARPDLG